VADEVLEAPLALSQLETAERISQALTAAGSAPIIELVGPDEGSKVIIADWMTRAVDRRLLRISAELLPVQLLDIENIGRLCQRESLLLPVIVYLEAEDIQPTGSDRATAVRRSGDAAHHCLARTMDPGRTACYPFSTRKAD
jgi:hypothetical protein